MKPISPSGILSFVSAIQGDEDFYIQPLRGFKGNNILDGSPVEILWNPLNPKIPWGWWGFVIDGQFDPIKILTTFGLPENRIRVIPQIFGISYHLGYWHE